MDIKPLNEEEGKTIFMRVSNELNGQLEQLKDRLHARGVSTVIRQILENTFKEGITIDGERWVPEGVPEEKPVRKTKRAA